MIVFYTAWVIVAAAFILTLVIKRTRQSSPQRPTSDTVIELACDADESENYEREFLSPETLQHLYDIYSSDHQPRTEADRHVDKLYKILGSESLDIESRLWVYNEIWDIKIAALADATTG